MNWISIILFIMVVGGISFYAYLQSRKLKRVVQMVILWEEIALLDLQLPLIIMTNLSTEQIVGQNGQKLCTRNGSNGLGGYGCRAVVLLAWVFLPKYLKYGVNTISEFLELRYDTFTKRLSPFYLSLPMSYLSCL